jgi:hypothetical protein
MAKKKRPASACILGHKRFILLLIYLLIKSSVIILSKNQIGLYTLPVLQSPTGIVRNSLHNMKMTVFWGVAPFSLVEIDRCFRGACCLHHQGNEISTSIAASSIYNYQRVSRFSLKKSLIISACSIGLKFLNDNIPLQYIRILLWTTLPYFINDIVIIEVVQHR